jgi:tetratricopeptide (TPR) repeat protein
LPAALEDFRRAHDLDPHHPRTHVDLALVLRLLGRVPEARAIVEDGMTHVVDNAELHEALADVLEAEGRADESMEERLKSRLMAGSTFDEIDQLRRAYGEAGRPGELRKENALLMESLQGKGANHGVRGVATALAENSALLRDRDQTLRWLGEAFERREEGPLSLNQPAYDFVRADSRFKAYRERLFGPNRHSAQK